MAERDFIGYGFAFPLGVDSRGGMDMVTGIENIERSIRLIIGTAYGERPMRPEFGCGIHDLVFEPVSVSLASRMRMAIEQSLARWETRADILGVSVTFDPDDPSSPPIPIHLFVGEVLNNTPTTVEQVVAGAAVQNVVAIATFVLFIVVAGTSAAADGQLSQDQVLLLGIGNVHSRTGDWERALEYDQRALEIAQRLDDEYIKGIGEVPSSWPAAALQAQAVAARSYALASVLAVDENGVLCGALNTHDLMRAKVI